jgi:hypothetical protein
VISSIIMKSKSQTPLPAYLKKNEDRMPWAALLHMRNIVALECPRRILKLSGPAKRQDKVIIINIRQTTIPSCLPQELSNVYTKSASWASLRFYKLWSSLCLSFLLVQHGKREGITIQNCFSHCHLQCGLINTASGLQKGSSHHLSK